MEGIIVCVIVGLAGLWAGHQLFRRRESGACSPGGCAACAGSDKAQPLVQLRRRT